MKDLIQTYRNKKGRFTKRGYAFDDDKVIKALEQSIIRTMRRSAAIGLVIGLSTGIVIGLCI